MNEETAQSNAQPVLASGLPLNVPSSANEPPESDLTSSDPDEFETEANSSVVVQEDASNAMPLDEPVVTDPTNDIPTGPHPADSKFLSATTTYESLAVPAEIVLNDASAPSQSPVAVPNLDMPTVESNLPCSADPVAEHTIQAASTAQLPLGLPAGVDLQKLLSSFASTTPISSDAQRPSLPPQSVVANRSPMPSNAGPSVVPTPSVPWQIQQAPTAPKADLAPSQPSDDALYEQFLVDEKRIMGNTAPHEFEPGSRLFVGNMSIESVSKRQIFLIFRKYGKLAQVALKTTYGFVQFLTARDCRTAMESEQGREVGGKKLHLEVSKPQTVRGSGNAGGQSRRRSRSPSRRSEARGHGRDAHEGYGRHSPARRSSPGRFHVPHDNQYPPRRSPSPRRHAPPEEFPLPLRYGSQIPDVQIVVLDEADRSYIYWVESAIRQASFKVETLFLSPRLGLPVVVRQMAKEGVLAVLQCNRQLQMVNKVTLQVFDRSQGPTNVRFDEYAGLDIATAIGLLKRTQQQALPPSAPPQQANLAAMIAQMDPASLQQVIGALSSQQQQPQQAPSYPGTSYPYRR